MALQYLEAFKALGQSPSTKYIFPLEFTELADAFRGYLEESNVISPAGPPPASAPAAPPSPPEVTG